MRAPLRWATVLLACVLFVAALVVIAPRLWIRTAHGHRTVERVLDRILNEHVPGRVSLGRLSGTVLTGLRADDVVVRNPAGAVIGRARFVAARWRPLALVRRRTIAEVEVERPELMLERARWRKAPAAEPGRAAKETVIAQITVRGGRLRWKAATFTRLDGSATLHSRSHLAVHGVWGRVAGSALRAVGTVGWGREPAWVATRFVVDRRNRLHGRGDVFYTRGELDGEVDELTIAAPVATRLVGGRGALRLRGRVLGGGGQVRGAVHAEQDGRALQLRVSVDRRRGVARIGARLAGVPRPIRLRARARYRPGALVVSSLHAALGQSRLDGRGALARRRVRAALRLHLVPSEARLFGLQPAAPIDVRLDGAGPVRALALRGRARLQTAQLAVRGVVDAPKRSGTLRLTAHAVQPARLWPRAPAVTVSGRLALAGRLVRRRFVGILHVAGGDVALRGRRVSELDGAARVQLARAGRASIRRLAGRWKKRRFTARGELAWSRHDVAFSAADLDVAGAHARAAGRYDRDTRRISVRADPLSLSPALLARVMRRPPPRAWTGRATIEGTPEDLSLTAAGATRFGAARVRVELVGTGARLDLRRVEAQLGDSHLVGAAHYRAGRLDASLDELVLAPALVAQLMPALQPTWPIRVQGALAGRPQDFDLTVSVDAGPSSARLRGRVAAREFRVAAHLDNLDAAVLRPTRRRVRITGELAASGRFAEGGAVGTLTIRKARGYALDSPFYRGWADVALQGRTVALRQAVIQVPGARLVSSGQGTVGKGFRVDFGVVITNALALRQVPEGLRVLVGINSILPGRSVAGSIVKRPGRKVEVIRRVLPIGLAQIDFLWRVLTGRLPRSEMRL